MRIFVRFWLTMIGVVALCAGCNNQEASLRSASLASQKAGASVTFGPGHLAPQEVQSETMSFADTYVTLCAQPLDDLINKSARPEVVDWALQAKIATATAAFTNATSPNEVVGMLDMVIFVTLKRQAMEDHWIPTLLHEEGAGVLAAFRKGESQAWEMAGRLLSPEQITELHELIDEWRKDHPDTYYAANIRLTEFAAARHLTAESRQSKSTNSVFSMLYIDPLANLDPVVGELRSYRDLTERLVYTLERSPTIWSWQAELVAQRSLAAPQIEKFVTNTGRFADNSGKFADATIRFADTAKKYPQDVSAELTKQREAINQSLDKQQDRITKLLGDANQLVSRIDQAGQSINTATSSTVSVGELATHRTLDHAFRLALILVLVILVGTPLVMIIYRFATRRLNHPS